MYAYNHIKENKARTIFIMTAQEGSQPGTGNRVFVADEAAAQGLGSVAWTVTQGRIFA